MSMRLILAPLADYTDAPFRRLCGEFGADMAYTEMISAAALTHDHAKTQLMLETLPGEVPLGCQLFGATETDLACATREVEKVKDRFVELNLNAGCPMPRLVRADSGACLAADPERTYRLLRAMKSETSLPVTLKTRPGPNPSRTTVFELLDAAEKAGAAAFILHARFTSQMHAGNVHLDILAEVVRRAHIPVIGNGGVMDAKTASDMAATGVAGVMVARSAFHRPWIFAEIRRDLGETAAHPLDLNAPGIYYRTARRHLELAVQFRRELADKYGSSLVPDEDAFVSLLARTKLFRYFRAMPNVSALRQTIAASSNLAELAKTLGGD